MKHENLDLYTLEFIESMFKYYSDNSTSCLGYGHLKGLIKRHKEFYANERETVRKHEQKEKQSDCLIQDSCMSYGTEKCNTKCKLYL